MASDTASAGPGFFRHHGVWAPGVRLFRNMRFVGKAAVICAVFLLVLAQPMALFVNFTNTHVDEALAQQQGVRLARDVLPLIVQVQSLRGAWHGANGQPTDAQRAAVADVEARLAALEAHAAASRIDLAEPLKYTRQAFQPLKAPAADAEAAFGAADEFAQQLQRLMVAVADTSGLSMDPEDVGYQLAIASTNETMQVIEMVGRLRDLGRSALERKQVDAFSRRIVQGDTYVLYGQLERLFARYERVGKADPAHDGALGFQKALDPVNAFVRGVRKSVLPESGPRGDAPAYAAAGGAAIESLAALTVRSYDLIDARLAQRVAALRLTRNLQFAGVGLGLAAALYLFWCFYLVTRGGMDEVARHVHAMAAGDLTTRPRPWGRDEAADLMRAVGEMQDSLCMLIGQVRGCAEDIESASGEVATGADDLSQRTEAAASRLQQAAATMDGIARTANDASRSIAESAERGSATAKAAERSRAVIGEVVRTMEEIQASSRRVADIVGVIDGIAFQTNILALNAAVEAARAGEQGRGFAVVAGEVRSLAQRSATAAREIKQLIAESHGRTQAGTGIVHAAGQGIAELVASVEAISTLLVGVRASTDEQARGVGEVTAAVAQLDQDTQRNAALVEQTSAAALSMKSKAAALTSTADRFVLPA